MIDRNFIVKNADRLKISSRYRKINENIPLNYVVSDHVCSKSKSVELRSKSKVQAKVRFKSVSSVSKSV